MTGCDCRWNVDGECRLNPKQWQTEPTMAGHFTMRGWGFPPADVECGQRAPREAECVEPDAPVREQPQPSEAARQWRERVAKKWDDCRVLPHMENRDQFKELIDEAVAMIAAAERRADRVCKERDAAEQMCASAQAMAHSYWDRAQTAEKAVVEEIAKRDAARKERDAVEKDRDAQEDLVDAIKRERDEARAAGSRRVLEALRKLRDDLKSKGHTIPATLEYAIMREETAQQHRGEEAQ